MEKEHIGTKIREIRKKQGLKVYELANKVGVNPVYITQIEKHGKLPSSSVFDKIEKTLNLPSEIRHNYLNDKYPELIPDDSKEKFRFLVMQLLTHPDHNADFSITLNLQARPDRILSEQTRKKIFSCFKKLKEKKENLDKDIDHLREMIITS